MFFVFTVRTFLKARKVAALIANAAEITGKGIVR
jgi:hypothetical protein